MDRAQRSRWTAWAYQAALGALLAGCAGASQGGANATEVDLGRGESAQGVRTLPAEGGEGRASGNGASNRKVAPLPAEFASLGKPCPAGAEPVDPGQPMVVCGRDHRIAALWKMSMGPVQALPEPVIRRGPAPSTPMEGFAAASVHLDGKHLWIASACAMCRVPSQSLWIGDLSLVTDEQIGQVQMQMGLPQEPALRDEKSWRSALAKSTPGD